MTLDELGGWPGVLGPLTDGKDLDRASARAAMGEILSGEATPAQIAAFAVGLRMKGETVEELGGMLDAMRAASDRVSLPDDVAAVDIVGTGGDRSRSINVSTIAAFVVAGAGAPVCKHGNRAASSACGAADLLEELGVVIELGPEGVASCVREAGMGFCFAPRFHPAMRHAGPPRRELGIPTAFNFLGPMANPAAVHRQLVGVSDHRMADRMAAVLAASGSRRALVVFGHDGLDELTTTTTSTVVDVDDGRTRTYDVDPAGLGFELAAGDALRGGDPPTNAEAARRVLSGEAGAHRDIVVLNAAAGLVAAGVADDTAAGIPLAVSAIDEGAAAEVLERLIVTSRAHADQG